MSDNDQNDRKMPLPTHAAREKLLNPEFLKPSSVPDMSPDISNASPIPMITENPGDPGRTRPASDEEIFENIIKSHSAPDQNTSLENEPDKTR